MGKSREMRLTHICCCCLLYQLGVLSNGIVSGKFFRDFRLALQLPQRKPRTHGSAGLVHLCAVSGAQRAAIKTSVRARMRASRSRAKRASRGLILTS
ncbi:hypothetical protein CB1_000719034 [Camelus ferus]|nr:hypothetical protein CB1_000719034 [Camelus ferus]